MTPESKRLFESLKKGGEQEKGQEKELSQEKSMGAMEAVKEGVLAIAPGLKNALQEIGTEMKRLGVQGAAELAAALNSYSNAYVPYGRGQQDAKSHDHERGGRER